LVRERRHRHVHDQALREAARQHDLVLDQRGAARQHRAHALRECLAARHALDRPPGDRLRGRAEDPARLGVELAHRALVVDDDDAVEQGVEHAAQVCGHERGVRGGGKGSAQFSGRLAGSPPRVDARVGTGTPSRCGLASALATLRAMRTDLRAGEALAIVLDAVAPLPPETCAAADALGRVLAEPVHAGRTLPPWDVSAMDGYALRAADLAVAPTRLPVAFEVAAGAGRPPALAPGAAARIFTGAPLPPGADTVVRQEDCVRDGAHVEIGIVPRLGDHVRPAGEDVREGELVLEPGTRLGPG